MKENFKYKVWIWSTVVIIAITVISGITVCSLNNHKASVNEQLGEKYDIFQSDFGKTYENELKNMKNVEFYQAVDKDENICVLNVISQDNVDNNIILAHMIYTHLNSILPKSNIETVRLVVRDSTGVFFDSGYENKTFEKSFCREDYIRAVEKKEELLYNS